MCYSDIETVHSVFSQQKCPSLTCLSCVSVSGLSRARGRGHRGDVHAGELRPANQVQLLRSFKE